VLSSLTLKFTAVSCPKCDAPVGYRCHSASGRKLAVLYPHVDRVRAFVCKFPNATVKKPQPATKPLLVDKISA
jgi:hypothetical protein